MGNGRLHGVQVLSPVYTPYGGVSHGLTGSIELSRCYRCDFDPIITVTVPCDHICSHPLSRLVYIVISSMLYYLTCRSSPPCSHGGPGNHGSALP